MSKLLGLRNKISMLTLSKWSQGLFWIRLICGSVHHYASFYVSSSYLLYLLIVTICVFTWSFELGPSQKRAHDIISVAQASQMWWIFSGDFTESCCWDEWANLLEMGANVWTMWHQLVNIVLWCSCVWCRFESGLWHFLIHSSLYTLYILTLSPP